MTTVEIRAGIAERLVLRIVLDNEPEVVASRTGRRNNKRLRKGFRIRSLQDEIQELAANERRRRAVEIADIITESLSEDSDPDYLRERVAVIAQDILRVGVSWESYLLEDEDNFDVDKAALAWVKPLVEKRTEWDWEIDGEGRRGKAKTPPSSMVEAIYDLETGIEKALEGDHSA